MLKQMLVNHKLLIEKQLRKQLSKKVNMLSNQVVVVNMVMFGLKLNHKKLVKVMNL